VGGLVPSLLIDQQNLPANVTPHVGTLDLDLGLAFALVGEPRYQEVPNACGTPNSVVNDHYSSTSPGRRRSIAPNWIPATLKGHSIKVLLGYEGTGRLIQPCAKHFDC